MSEPSSPQKRSVHFVDADEGCALEASSSLLVDAWATKYHAVKQTRLGSCWEVAGDAFVKVTFPLKIAFVARSHEHYPAAVREAHAISSILTIDPCNASIYYYYRFYLADAGYTEAQLESVPCPQEIPCLHMRMNGTFSCMGKIHKARKAGEEQQHYYCSDCAWISPPEEGGTRQNLRDDGVFLLPIDATYLVPFAEPDEAVFWTRRVLLQQGFMLTLTRAATLLELTRQALRDMCVLGMFHRFDHPDIPDEFILYTNEVEKYRLAVN